MWFKNRGKSADVIIVSPIRLRESSFGDSPTNYVQSAMHDFADRPVKVQLRSFCPERARRWELEDGRLKRMEDGRC